MEAKSTRYEILLGIKFQGKLKRPLVCGHAFLHEGETYYNVKLMIFPGQTYYLTKKRDSQDQYTVFSKIVRTNEGVKFQNPVGVGRLNADLSSHLEIYFPVLRSQMFMCLFPVNS